MIRHRIDTSKLTTVAIGVMPGDWSLMSVSDKAAKISAKYPGISTQTLIETIARLDAKHPIRPTIEYRERTVVVPSTRAAGAPPGASSVDNSVSNFNTGATDAYWQYVEGSFANTCITSGNEFVTHLNSTLGTTSGATWDAATQDALIVQVAAFARLDPAWQSVLTALQQDRSAQTVSPETSLRTGLFLAYYHPGGRRFDSIILPSGTIAPVWGQAVAPPARGYQIGLRCYDTAVDPDPRAATADQVAQAIANSFTGVRLEPGRAAPSSASTAIDRSSGVKPLTVLLFSVLFVGVGVLVLKK